MAPMLSIIVPVYREEARIVENIRKLTEALLGTGESYQVLVVCDGDADTFDSALAAKDDLVCVLGYSPNMGKGYALRYGFERARGNLVAFIDADLDLDPHGIAALLAVQKDQNADVVVGSKRHPASEVEYPRFRRFQSWVYQGIVRALFDLNLTDTQTGLKLFRREVLDAVMPRMRVRRFAFDLELLVVARKLGFTRIVEAPVRLNYHFSSTTGLAAVFDVLADTLRILWRLRIRHAYDSPQAVPMALVCELNAAASEATPGRD